jgi:hypothetical protein
MSLHGQTGEWDRIEARRRRVSSVYDDGNERRELYQYEYELADEHVKVEMQVVKLGSEVAAGPTFVQCYDGPEADSAVVTVTLAPAGTCEVRFNREHS